MRNPCGTPSGNPSAILLLPLLLLGASSLAAQEEDPSPGWDVTMPRGETVEVDFLTEEGTWMSVDVSPDERWLAFDLLGHVYRVGVDGGEATPLTQDSGVAINIQPRISPDGSTIAFISDREGQNNLWLMDADGGNPRAVFTNPMVRVTEPAWTPDGQYVVVRRQALGPGGGSGIWMYHRDGGSGVELVGGDQRGASWPSPSPDGRHLYFAVHPSGESDALRGAYQLRRLDLETGRVSAVTSGQASQQVRSSSGGAAAPEVSPDGRWLAFARRIPDGTFSFKGKRFGPRTALWLRDLETGAERLALDPIELAITESFKVLRVLPGYAWSRDGRSIYLSRGGGLHRLDVVSGELHRVPFSARVRRTASEQAYTAARIEDDPAASRFTRWQTASPDGMRLAFQAVGKIWVMAFPDGEPQRLTPTGFGPFEFAPAWSPDGRWVAFTTAEDGGDGHLWKVPAGGGDPVRLTDAEGEYTHPAWSPDGLEILFTRGGGATARGRGMVWNTSFFIERIPAAGGAETVVARIDEPETAILSMRNQIVRASWGPEGRIYFPRFEEGESGVRTAFVSVRSDGSDERVHLTLPWADEVVVSPDGRRVAFQEADNVYVAPLPAGAGGDPVHVTRTGGALPVTPLSLEGGLFPRWRDETTVELGSGDRYMSVSADGSDADTVRIRLMITPDRAPGTMAFTGGRLVTLEDVGVIEGGTLIVRDGRIQCVGTCDVSGVDSVVDASGKTLIPGFIDVHSHNFREARGMVPRHNYEVGVFLAYGITTVMDPSLWSQNIFAAAELIGAGEIVGPRVFSTGDPLYAGDGSRQVEIGSYQDAEALIERLRSWGAISLKEYLQPRRDQRQWITDVARSKGLMVTAEGGDLAYNIGMMLDGHTGWEHPFSYVPLYGDVARFFGALRTVYSPTFSVGGPGPWNEEYFIQESEVWRDAKQRRWLSWRQLVPHTRRRTLRPETDYSYPLIAQGLADIVAEGGYGAIGAHAQQNGVGSHWEVWMAASAMDPLQALEVASLHGAYFIGRDRDLGSLAVGKLADLMVLDANPLEDIRNTLSIRYVMKGGRLYEGDTLDEVWPRARPYGTYPWVNQDQLRTDDRPIRGNGGDGGRPG